jgi:hypothetical protein
VGDKAFSHPPTNLLDWVESNCNWHSQCNLSAHVSHRDDDVDLYLTGHDGAVTLADLARSTDPDAHWDFKPQEAQGRIQVELPGERIEEFGNYLEEGESTNDPLRLRRIADGELLIVNFADPNTTKALHVGHLRNLAVGQAIASMAEAAGATVIRQSRVGDFGRNMGEAMAGYVEFCEEAAGATQASTLGPGAEKSDHFVGRHYMHYVSRNAESAIDAGVSAGNAALARERHLHEDLAEDLLTGWLEGDEDTRALFDRIRSWAVEGQDATMARLGIVMDRTLFESDYLGDGEALLELGLKEGIFERAESGAVRFPTGTKELPHLLLTRSDGFPTQHLRYIATWWAISEGCRGARTVGVLGSEWGPLSRCTESIMERLGPAGAHPQATALHGMVTSDHRIVKSSAGGALLLDKLIDDLLESPMLALLCEEHDRCSPESLVGVIALSLFLRYPATRPLSLSDDAVEDPKVNFGWVLAKAWAEAWDSRFDGTPDPDAGDLDYRRLIIRSQLLRRALARGTRTLDAVPLANVLRQLSTWFNARNPSPRTARAMRSVLASGFSALGLMPSLPRPVLGAAGDDVSG